MLIQIQIQILITVLFLLGSIFGTAAAAERNWVQVHYDSPVPVQTRRNVDAAIDVVADLLTEYGLPLRQNLTVIVTADTESYMAALNYYGQSLEKARQTAEHTAGVSFNNRAAIVLHGTPALQSDRGEVFRVLPHEIFHQVQSQFGRMTTATWMVEAAPELFQLIARERAGLGAVEEHIGSAVLRVATAKSIPNTQALMTTQYEQFSTLAQQGYPVYPMSLLMLYQLTGKDRFVSVVQFYRLLNQGMQPESAFQALFRRPQFLFADEMDKFFNALRQQRPATPAA